MCQDTKDVCDSTAFQRLRDIKKKVFSFHTKNTNRGRCTASLILSIGTRLRRVANFMPWLLYPLERTAIPIKKKARWAPELVWRFWRREKSLAHTRI